MPHGDVTAGAVPVRGPRARSVRFGLPLAGVSLVAGGVLWQPLLAAEHLGHLDHLERRSGSWGWYVDQDGFLLAMVLVLVGLTALDRARVAGGRRVGRWAMHGLVLGWLLLVLAQAAMVWFSWSEADTVTGVGGLLTYPTVLAAGAAVVRSRTLTGWRRWSLLGVGLYQTTLILVPLLLGAAGPGWLVEAGWQLCWVGVGVAALQQAAGRRATSTRERPHPSGG